MSVRAGVMNGVFRAGDEWCFSRVVNGDFEFSGRPAGLLRQQTVTAIAARRALNICVLRLFNKGDLSPSISSKSDPY